MHPEDEFEEALQKYERAVAEYMIAWRRYVAAVGKENAHHKLDEAMNRICYHDRSSLIVVDQEEVDRRAAHAIPIVDAYMEPDIYGGPIWEKPEPVRAMTDQELHFQDMVSTWKRLNCPVAIEDVPLSVDPVV